MALDNSSDFDPATDSRARRTIRSASDGTFVTRRVYVPNIEKIKVVGLKRWLEEQRGRRAILGGLFANYNEGRSRSFYWIATTLMPFDLIKEALGQAKQSLANDKVNDSDIKAKAKIIRSIIQDLASRSDVDLKLRKKPE